MKRLITITLSVLAGFMLALLFLGPTHHVCAGATRTATQNGDTNGDGGIDVSDAVYLLQWLFAGGPDLAKVESPSIQPQSCLVGTGQKQCAGTSSFIDCSVPKARGQDAYYQKGCPVEGRFVDNGDGTISDSCTGLMWTKTWVDVDNDGEIVTGDGFMNPGPDELEWLEACNLAEDMTYLGHDDWRVPNIQELLSLVNWTNATQSYAPLYPVFSYEANGQGTWSSTYATGPGNAFGIGIRARIGACDCCVVRNIPTSENHLFVAVRGP